MSYIALYRSYRPKKFSEVIGQVHVKQTLQNAVMEEKTSHAYIFSGSRGIGKTTIARILAKAVNCLNPIDGEPCNECQNCLAIINNETTDIIELDAASNNGVDEMRDILEKVNFLPSSLKKKVYIIDEAHMLSTAAFNALLKTLEEPPHHVIFVLATTEPHKIPLTILSRCQRFDFKQFTKDELKQELQYIIDKEQINISSDAVEAISEAAEGGMRDALSILDQAVIYANDEVNVEDVNNVTGRISHYKMIEFLESLKNKDVTQCISIIDELVNIGKEINRIVSSIIQFCRDILLYKNLNNVNPYKYIYQNENFIKLANNLSKEEIFYYIDSFSDVQNKIRYSNTQKIFVEVAIMKIINSVSTDIDVLNKIRKLENSISNISTGNNYNSSNLDIDSKFIGLDNKIKKITSEIEKAEIEKFKESVESKIDMLEEISSKNASMPTDLNFRMDEIEDKIRVLLAENQTSIPVELKEVLEKIENLENNSLNQSNAEIDKKITEIEEKINNIISLTNNNSDELNNKERIDRLEEYIKLFADQVENSSIVSNLNNFSDTQELNELKENYFVLVQAVQDLKQKDNASDDIYNNDKLNQLESSLNELFNKINNFETTVKNINNTIEIINNDKTDYEQKLNALSKSLEENISLLNEKEQNMLKQLENMKVSPVKSEEKKDINIRSTTLEKQVVEEKTVLQPVKEETTQPVVEVNEANTVQTVRNVYDVRVIEKILHEARDIECREEKARLINAWPKLEDKVGYVLASAAKMLLDGKLAANGKHDILIVYPKASICNQLMEPKNYNDAKQVLRITFGKDYDFIALPENVWQEKRSEYIGQYGVGIKYPKLTPINNPELKVVVVNYDQINNNKKPVQQARSFFGAGKVEEEK